MADKKISELDPVPSAAELTDEFAINQSAASHKVTLAQMKTAMLVDPMDGIFQVRRDTFANIISGGGQKGEAVFATDTKQLIVFDNQATPKPTFPGGVVAGVYSTGDPSINVPSGTEYVKITLNNTALYLMDVHGLWDDTDGSFVLPHADLPYNNLSKASIEIDINALYTGIVVGDIIELKLELHDGSVWSDAVWPYKTCHSVVNDAEGNADGNVLYRTEIKLYAPSTFYQKLRLVTRHDSGSALTVSFSEVVVKLKEIPT